MGITQNGVPIGTTTTLGLYKYEPFSYTYSGTGGDTVTLVSASTLVRTLVTTSGSDVIFTSTGYTGSVSTAESIVLLTSPGNVTYTINVTLSAGRFTAPVSSSFTFNKNTSVATTYGAPILFTSPIAISPPTTIPTLPPGISFVQVDSQNYQLTGTPLATAPAQSFTIYGFGLVNTSQVVSKIVTITIAGEIISLSIDGGSNIPALNVGMPVGDRAITAVYPLSIAGNLAYTWSNLPDGLFFKDDVGIAQSSPFYPVDSNSTMVLTGTPTLLAAQQFAASGSSNRTVRVRATRLTPTPLSADLSLNFTFAPTVLFTSTPNVSIYAGDPIDPGQVTITAQTFFDPLNTPIALITAPILPPGVGLNYTSGSSNAFLAGTATTPAGSTAYTFTADNSNGVTRDTSINITVSNDVAYFLPSSISNDVCYNFVISRPLVQDLSGYYPAPIQYSAAAISGSSISLSITNLPAGVTANVSGNTLSLSGIPNTVTGLTTSTITATATNTGANVSRTLKWAVVNDVFTIVSPTLPSSNYTYIQHRLIDPVQFQATTLSGRSVSFWTPCNSGIYALPVGMSLSAQGKLTGAPDSNNGVLGDGSFPVKTFRITASTGYATGTFDISYATVGDFVLTGFDAGQTVTTGEVFSGVEMYGLPYSARTEPVVLQIKDNSLRLRGIGSNPTVAITNNMLSGDFTTADPLFPFYYFDVCGQFLGNSEYLGTVGATVTNADYAVHLGPLVSLVSNERFPTPSVPTYSPAIGVLSVINDTRFVAKARFGAITEDYAEWNSNVLSSGNTRGATDFCDVNVSTGNTAIAVAGEKMYRSTDGGQTWSTIASSNISGVLGVTGYYYSNVTYGAFSGDLPYMASVATDNSSNWVCVGRGYNSLGQERSIVRESTDDGLTWTDYAISPPIVLANQRTKLNYNAGRYFLTQFYSSGYSGVYTADPAVDIKGWLPAGIFQSSGGALTFAANGNKVMIGGSADASGNTLYLSSNNGDTWSAVTNPLGSALLLDGTYGDGKWVVSSANYTIYSTNDGASWSYFLTRFGGTQLISPAAAFMNVIFDKSGWMMMFTRSTQLWLNGHNPDTMRAFFQPFWIGVLPTPPVNTASYSFKRIVYSVIKSSAPASITWMAPANGFQEFIDVTPSTSYTLFQFCPISPITVNTDAPVKYIYYWARNLPRGLSLTFPDPADGDPSQITGTPSQYSDANQTVQLRSVTAYYGGHAYREIDMRVILPYIMKKQDGASGYTAWLRQYVNINGAQNARDSVVLPTQVQSLGEFTAPPAPSVVTDSNCPC